MIRGFLGHLALVQPITAPYLKGMHQTIEGWRQHREPAGWKLRQQHHLRFVEMEGERRGMPFEHCSNVFDDAAKRGPSELVRPNPGLFPDVRDLMELTNGKNLLQCHCGLFTCMRHIVHLKTLQERDCLRLSSFTTTLMLELRYGAVQKKKFFYQNGKNWLT